MFSLCKACSLLIPFFGSFFLYVALFYSMLFYLLFYLCRTLAPFQVMFSLAWSLNFFLTPLDWLPPLKEKHLSPHYIYIYICNFSICWYLQSSKNSTLFSFLCQVCCFIDEKAQMGEKIGSQVPPIFTRSLLFHGLLHSTFLCNIRNHKESKRTN